MPPPNSAAQIPAEARLEHVRGPGLINQPEPGAETLR